MKKISLYIIAIVSVTALAACNYDDGFGYTHPGYAYSQHYQKEPARTAPGMVVFEYVYGTLQRSDLFVTNLLMFDKYYRATDAEKLEMRNGYFRYAHISFNETAGTWEIDNSYYGSLSIKMLDGLSLTDPGAEWSVSSKNAGYLSIGNISGQQGHPAVIRYNGPGSIEMNIHDNSSISSMFTGAVEMTVGFLETKKYSYRDFDLSFTGKGKLKSTSENWFSITFSAASPLTYTYNNSQFKYPAKFLNGELSMTVMDSRGSGSSSDVKAVMSDISSVTITYQGITEKWEYPPKEGVRY